MNNQQEIDRHREMLRERALCDLHEGRGPLLPIVMVALAVAMAIGMLVGASIRASWDSLPIK